MNSRLQPNTDANGGEHVLSEGARKKLATLPCLIDIKTA